MSQKKTHYKYLMIFAVAFIACYLTQGVLLNRLIDMGGFYITGGTFIYFLTPLISDVVAEVYGYRVARQLLWLGIFAVIFLTVSVLIVIKLPAPIFWVATDHAYFIAFNSVPREDIAGTFAVIVGQFVNIYLVSKWKILLRGKYFWLRSVAASIIGDGLTVSLSIFLIFSGRIPSAEFKKFIIPELIVMVVFTMIGGVPASIIAKLTAKAEGIDLYDKHIKFNPFKFKVDQ